eukprot:10232903-Karenia_brevis.AAC.1
MPVTTLPASSPVQATAPQVWWQCPKCDFVILASASGRSQKKYRHVRQHVKDEVQSTASSSQPP